MMKKSLAILLVLALAMSCAAAVAETAPELPFDGSYATFEEHGMAVALPNEWSILEVPEEAAAVGIFFIAASPDGANTVQISFNKMDTPIADMDALVADLATAYANVTPVEINGIQFAKFTLVEQDLNAMCCMTDDNLGLYSFYFTPASDKEFLPLAEAIAGTVTPYTAK